ncbi:MAG: radical SAM protein, partial [Oscillospiraceae bacterium]|nr:radical SAM protein [Oscillospiraceae bacterium]
NAYNFGASLCTKSALVARDADILKDIKRHSPVIVNISITTVDDGLCKIIEPNVSVSSERFEAIRKLSDSGIFCGVLLVPVLPFICDTEENILSIIRMAKDAGAKYVYSYMGMTLRQGNREYYYENLDRFFPGVKEKYEKRYGYRYSLSSPRIKKLWQIYEEECKKLGLLCNMRSIIRSYKAGYKQEQLSLF